MEQTLLGEIKQRILPLLEGEDVELVELRIVRERGRFILRFLVDKSAGITLDECARLNRSIGRVLDAENIIQQRYILEVSSPGLDRPLVNTQDFQRSRGKPVKVVLRQPQDGQNVWIGLLDAVDAENIIIRTQKNESLRIARKDIARVNLEVRT